MKAVCNRALFMVENISPRAGTWSGKMHAMIKFQRSGTTEKGDIRLTLKID